MTQKHKLKYLAMCLCLGVLGSYAFGQDLRPVQTKSRVHPTMQAEKMINEPQTLEEKRAAKAAAKPRDMEKKVVVAPAAQPRVEKTVATKKELTREEFILQLTDEMKANQNNPNYDMKAAVQKLRTSPYVIYTLGHYDPNFPIIFRTGDAAVDQQNYDQAKVAWKAAQK